MKNSSVCVKSEQQDKMELYSGFQSNLLTWHGSSSTPSVFLPKPQYKCPPIQSSGKNVPKPKIQIELPDPQHYLAQSIHLTALKREQEYSKPENVSFPILEMILKQTVNRDTLDSAGRLYKALNTRNTEYTRSRELKQESIMRNEVQNYPHFLTSKLVYHISYRLAHKFTFRFKTIELEFDTVVSVERFKKMLFQKVFKSAKMSKDVFIEKERDLVPLIDMSQLFTSKMNYLQIRSQFKRLTVIEKPVLMKKKIRPTIGLTELSNAPTQQSSTSSRVMKIKLIRSAFT